MKKRSIFSLMVTTSLFFGGCGTTVDDAVMGSGDRDMGSLSGEEVSLKEVLKNSSWKSIEMDLDKFLYDTDVAKREYEVEMNFTDKKVYAEANCQEIEASYKISDDTLTFSKISMRPSTKATCKESDRADSAVYSFLNHSYTMLPSSRYTLKLTADDIESEVRLKR
jgi:heat shock protein HslJ